MSDLPFRVTDYSRFDRIRESLYVGQAFAFLDEAGARRLEPPESGARVLSLLGDVPIELPGVSVGPRPWSNLQLLSITSDKALYQAGRDTARLLIADLSGGKGVRRVRVSLNGSNFIEREVTLDAQGIATLALSDLPVGDYEVSLPQEHGAAPSATFAVAEYRLSPLVATLVQRQLQDDGVEDKGSPKLQVTLRVESFGVPVVGGVKLELTDRGVRAATVKCVARGGLVEARFALAGAGPHAIQVRLAEDPARTATVVLHGTKTEELEPTVFSELGVRVRGALVPRGDAVPVRGVFLEEGETNDTPFQLRAVSSRAARIVTKLAATHVHVVVKDGTDVLGAPAVERVFDSVAAGEEIVVDVPFPVALVAIGAFVSDRPWEGYATLLAPETLAAHVDVPATAAPGESVPIEVRIDGARSGSAYVIVKDARLPTNDTPANQLAGRIKAFADQVSDSLHVGFVERDVHEAGFAVTATAWDGALLRAGGERHADAAIPLDEPSGSDVAAVPARDVDAPEVLFAGIVPLKDGKGEVVVGLPTAFADYQVEAFVVSGGDWASVASRFRAVRDPFVELLIPSFLHPADAASGRLIAGSAKGTCRVSVTCDGEGLPLVQDGVVLGEDAVFDAPRAEFGFAVRPGEYRAVITPVGDVGAVHTGGEGDTRVADAVTGRVLELGKLRSIARQLRFLQPGERVDVDVDDAISSPRVLPGLDQPFRFLVNATADYAHMCCEQTGAKIVAACAMYAFAGGDDEPRARAREVIAAGVRRERSMFLPGRGFKMYPDIGDTPNPYWGKLAALHLQLTRTLREALGSAEAEPELRRDLTEACAMADDACAAYGLAWPPSEVTSCADAFAVVRFSEDEGVRNRALAWARAARPEAPVTDRDGPPFAVPGAVGRRTECAYAAATLLRGREAADVPRALVLANQVVTALGARGALYSTLDSAAAIALMTELVQAGLMPGDAALVRVDGVDLPYQRAITAGAARTIEALEDTVVVEVTRSVEDDWFGGESNVAMEVSLERGGKSVKRLKPGDACDLVVTLRDRYKDGDLLWICLPPALSRVAGGGQIKMASIDFAGADTLRVPLVATGQTVDRNGDVAPQHFAVRVRNMFEEERVGHPGRLAVTVSNDAGPGPFKRLLRGLGGGR